MKRHLLPFLLVLLLPMTASAQWTFSNDFPDNPDLQFRSVHGVAVTPDGMVWVQPFYADGDSVFVDQLGALAGAPAIHIFNPDGTPADTIKFVDFGGGDIDTLGGFWNASGAWEETSGRGIATDGDGNILASQDQFLYKIDYQTHEGLAKAEFTGPITEATSDDNGNVFVALVVPPQPIFVMDSNLENRQNAVDIAYEFSRDFAVSPDGNRIFWAGYTERAVIEYARADEFSDFDSVGVVIPGMSSESMGYNPDTGLLWVSSGSANDGVNLYETIPTSWVRQTWYAFNIEDFAVNTAPTALDSITWVVESGLAADSMGRPRGIAFSPDGNTAYVANFEQAAPAVQEFMREEITAIEPVGGDLPENFTLSQNYPNPFNPSTEIQFTLKESGYADLRVYDMLGREVDVLINETLPAGGYTATFDASNLSSGTYLYVLEFGGKRLSGKMLLVK